MKRIVFCFDGTWNKIDSNYPTNVARIAQSVARSDGENQQIVHYDEGVGTSRTEKWSGGIFGHGLKDNILEAYHFLVLNYDPGDQIYVFGFSRGAFSARSFVGLIRNAGIMSRRSLNHIREAVDLYTSRKSGATPNSEKARAFRFSHCPKLCLPGDLEWRKTAYPEINHDEATDISIRFMGVWDTVGALGVPKRLKWLNFVNRKYLFHDTKLSSFVHRAYHAVAADEKRTTFEPALWSNLDDLNASKSTEKPYRQLIFPGVHSAVGGGGPVRGLSDISLDWIIRAARKEELAFDLDPESPIFQLRPDPKAQLFNAEGKLDWSISDVLSGFGLRNRKFGSIDRTHLDISLARRFQSDDNLLPERTLYRPESLNDFWEIMENTQIFEEVDVPEYLSDTEGLWDERALRAPDKVRKYILKANEKFKDVAATEMGGEENEAILILHNQNIGKIYDPSYRFAGMEIEIPVYSDLKSEIVQGDEK